MVKRANADLSKAQAADIYEEYCNTIRSKLKGDGKLAHALGSFKVVHRAERAGRNPQTGKSITIPAKNVVKFKASKATDELVN